MTLIEEYLTGAEEWHCAMCDRRLVMTWQPFKRIILNAGDETAIHSGSRGGLRIGRVEVEEAVPDEDLSAWLNALM